MKPFDFEKVYEEFARQFDNRSVPTNPFGPVLAKVVLEEDGIFVVGILPPVVMLPFFTSDEGAEHLERLIAELLDTQGDNFCLVKTYECHMKVVKTNDEMMLDAMRDRQLAYDPMAQNCIAMMVYHRTGVRTGCLPIDADRISHYAPMMSEETQVTNIKTGAKPMH